MMNKGNQITQKTKLPMLLSMAVTKGYIESCQTPAQLETADRLVTNFKKLYAGEVRLPVHESELQFALQNARIEVQYLNNIISYPEML